MSQFSIFVPINKIDEEQRLVYGTVAAEVMDNSGEMFDYEGSKDYFAKWSENAHATSGGKSYGNVRVMHTSKVAGIVSSPLGFDDENRVIEACAKVVDDAEWEMVKAGGYTGFSMGGRYVSRATKSDGVKTYIADPCEISLVDKPCIPTATFSVVKADGITETHRFRDDLYIQKADDMPGAYTPTNDEMLPVAQDLAKAAGKTGPNDWLDFMDAARDELVAKNDTGAAPVSEEAPQGGADGEAPAQQPQVDKADNPFAGDKDAKEGKEGDDKGDGDGGDGAEDDDAAKQKKKEEEEAAAKADGTPAPELLQGWKAKDGSFHVKKADAIAHNATLEGPAAEPTASEVAAALIEKADRIANGEAEEPATTEEPALAISDVIDGIEGPLGKFTAFRDSDTLVKSMYDVERLARIISSLESLHCSLTCWGSSEEDHSPVASDVLESLKGLGDNLITLATGEIKEIVERSGKRSGVDIVFDDGIMELSASTLGLEKSDLADTLQKRAAPIIAGDSELLAKVDASEKTAADAIAKADAAEAELTKVNGLLGQLSERLDKFAAMPMPKAPVRLVTKGDDATGSAQAAPAPTDLSKFSQSQLADAAIRLAQNNGTTIAVR